MVSIKVDEEEGDGDVGDLDMANGFLVVSKTKGQRTVSSLSINDELEDVGVCELDMASGFLVICAARGIVVMANIFLSGALIYLAAEEVGCILVDEESGEMKVDNECDERVYGVFRPAALITNIAVISGVISAFMMPVAGAIMDYTSHRWTVGVVSSSLIIVIAFIQVFTSSQNWFVMALLQALWGCFYHVMTLASYAYLPDMAREVPEKTMTKFTSIFTMMQFGAQTVFLLIVVAVSYFLKLDNVQTARWSQGMDAFLLINLYWLGWSHMPHIEPRNTLREGKSLLWEGFAQSWRTAVVIRRDYSRSLYWFLWGTTFSEPAAGGFTVASLVFLTDHLQMNSTQVGVVFFLALISMVPGGLIANAISQRTNPRTSIYLAMCVLFLLALFGGLYMTPENAEPVTYYWGVVLGLALGTYYPSLKLFLTFVIPKNQEAEMVGLFVNCSQVLAWLPPLIFSMLVEGGVDIGVGLICMGGFFLLSIAIFSMAAPFEELVEEVRSNDQGNKKNDEKDKADEDDSHKEGAADVRRA